jgi:capsular exopolysaccharide synthesis family protein
LISFNLAVSFAESGRKVVFVDADLRRSITVGRYKPDRAVLGLTHFLSGQKAVSEVLYETNIENMDVIFTGPAPPNPADLLSSTHFMELLETLQRDYDYVIIDTPPLGSVIDSAIIAENCDGIVLVIEANTTSYKMAQKVINQLQKGNCKILGAILNKVDMNSIKYKNYGRKYKKYDKDYYSK